MPANSDKYRKYKEIQRARIANISLQGRDIYPLIQNVGSEIRAAAGQSLQRFIETYLISMFADGRGAHWAWSKTHLDIMARIEDAVLRGKLFAVAMPRGGGKTSLLKAGTLWAILYGYRKWVCLIAATAGKSAKILEDIQTILETNTLLLAHFREAIEPIVKLERISARQRGQLYNGRPTRVLWNSDTIIFPDIPGSLSNQSIITCTGLDGAAIRGQVKVLPTGQQIRPDLVFLDDPQTDDVAKSEFQTADRIALLEGAVLNMGPPGTPIAGLMACTVIRDNDMADRVLKLPQWHGIRAPMMIQFPVHMSTTPPNIPHREHWDHYAKLDEKERTAYYAAHRCLPECEPLLDQTRPCGTCKIRDECMDAGAMVSWIHRKYPADLSAIQHAMNKYYANPALFAAEMQQQPIVQTLGGNKVTPADVVQRVSGLPMNRVPPAATILTGAIDVHDEILYWVVCAWQENFTGQVIAYGTYPEQTSRWFRQADPPRKLSRAFPDMTKDAVIQAGLERLCNVLLHTEYERNSQKVGLQALLVDSGYKPGIVQNVRRKIGSTVLQASKGVGLGAKNKPVAAYQKKPGWIFGRDWYIPNVGGTSEYPHLVIDTNAWKSYVHRALAVAPGTAGALTLYGNAATMGDHEAFAEHVAGSEYFTEVSANGRVVLEYKALPSRPDNHWLDCLVMATVGASRCGAKTATEEPEKKAQRVSFSEMQRRRRMERK